MLPLLSGVQSTSTALEAERIRMEVITQNIANANTSRGPDGKPYQRQEVVFEAMLNRQLTGASALDAGSKGVMVSRITKDSSAPRLVYNPGHPDANPQGMVAMPNINVHEEMVDMIAASRSFEANLAVVKNARSMALQTLSIGKRA
ncbi:MAG: flagellar basal-body rod protein FlgC [Limisphaerales bacterium]|nr:MAG: flagellar basal-body rod protein FlgC [Limisphaerales bacterium]KAG0507084.1 MAG: flagellar basal-body rod protein FlgC [Limisphaerales bacterium]TXT49288.1 MAG: flagellar basal-body rod protein FlgC [Limisphaerales bacterium]